METGPVLTNGYHNGNGIHDTADVIKTKLKEIIDTSSQNGKTTIEGKGPEQVLPATQYHLSYPDSAVKLRVTSDRISCEPPLSVPGLLSRTVSRFPDTPAICNKLPDGTWNKVTFREYQKLIHTCAKGFLKLGLEQHHSVAILGFNSPEWFISDLAAIHAGGIAVGIYTTNSPEACHHVLFNSQANIVVVEDSKQMDKIEAIWSRLPKLKVAIQWEGEPKPSKNKIIKWADMMAIGKEEDDTQLNHALKNIAINQCCTLVYTSGTVGQPKGTMLSHDNLVWEAHAITKRVEFTPGDESIVSYLPLSHVAAQMVDIYMSMDNAITIYFGDKNALKGSLISTLQEAQPTKFIGVPRVWEKIHEKMTELAGSTTGIKKRISTWAKQQTLNMHVERMNGNPDYTPYGYLLAKWLVINRVHAALGLSRCRLFVTAAAPLSTDVKQYFLSLDIPIMDVFGMSEVSGAHTISLPREFTLESVGKALPGTETKFDKADPKTGDGELCLRGRHTFMGYLFEPKKTEDTFDSDGFLHSGDVGRMDNDGYIIITGRIKELLITAGGENVAPVAIEQQLKTELPLISHAMVVGDKRKFLSVLFTLKTNIDNETGNPLDTLSLDSLRWLQALGSSEKTVTEVLANKSEKVWKAITNGIQRANEYAISNAQKIQKFSILPVDFGINSGELGPTMKIKRNVVSEKYADIIEELYNV